MPNKTKLAIYWNTIEIVGKQLITFIITIVLARLLQPEDFGLIGMVYVFIMIATGFVGGGFTAALIYKKEVNIYDYSSVFYFSIFAALIIYVIIFISSNFIASFYNQPKLVSILRWLSISFVLGSLTTVHYAIYARKMDFKITAKIGIISQVIAGVSAIIIAKLGGGVWALVAQNLIMNFITVLMFFIFNTWRPIIYFNIKKISSLFKYGSNILIGSIMNQVFDNLYYVIIGKFFSSGQLGYYVQANKIQKIPSDKIQQVIQRSTFPEFTRIADDSIKTKIYFTNLFKNALFINFPLLISLAALSNDIVLFLLTDKWVEIAPYVELLCFASLFLPIFTLCSNAILSKGHSFLNLKIDFIKKILLIINILIAFNWGILGLIIGQIINSVLFIFIQFYYTKKIIQIDTLELYKTIFQYLLIGITPYLLIKLTINYFSFNHFMNILIYGSGYFLIYLSLAQIFKLNERINLKSILNIK